MEECYDCGVETKRILEMLELRKAGQEGSENEGSEDEGSEDEGSEGEVSVEEGSREESVEKEVEGGKEVEESVIKDEKALKERRTE